jgi:hypothetical protein
MLEFVEYKDMPDDNEDMAKIDIVFPPLTEEQTKRYPSFVENLVDYINTEEENEECLCADDLKFIKAVQVKEKRYWIWEFFDTDNYHSFAVVSENLDSSLVFCYDTNRNNLSSDQFILGHYHKVF